MDAVRQRRDRRTDGEDGFSLIEVMAATVVLSTGLFALVGVFSLGVMRMTASTPMLIAREKAREAIESVHAARDNGELAWNTVKNVADGGIFVNGAQPLKAPGTDGLVNTADDGDVETMRKPGKDQVLNTADDETIELNDFTRQITISTMLYDNGAGVNPNLRSVTVDIRYRVNGAWRVYSLTSYVSSYS
jgi:prepilin-type N-terminal cleavage/methylation domain-containing protein